MKLLDEREMNIVNLLYEAIHNLDYGDIKEAYHKVSLATLGLDEIIDEEKQ